MRNQQETKPRRQKDTAQSNSLSLQLTAAVRFRYVFLRSSDAGFDLFISIADVRRDAADDELLVFVFAVLCRHKRLMPMVLALYSRCWLSGRGVAVSGHKEFRQVAGGGSADAHDAGFQAVELSGQREGQLMLMMLAFRPSSGHRRVG